VKITQIRNRENDITPSYRAESPQNIFRIINMLEHMEAGDDIKGLGPELGERISSVEDACIAMAACQTYALRVYIRAFDVKSCVSGKLEAFSSPAAVV